jgi:membrane protein implicated in regulation of membrane protease activity
MLDWDPPTLWWLAAGALVAVELATGTFYLLMLALGCVAGALAAHIGIGETGQILAAALLGLTCTALWHLRRARHPGAAPAESNPDVNLDIGQTVQVQAWNPDGTTRVQYRGAAWSARLAQQGIHKPGSYRIVAVHGSELRLAPAQPD